MILPAIVGGILMCRPLSSVAIDQSLLAGGRLENHASWGGLPTRNQDLVADTRYLTNEDLRAEESILMLSIPRSAFRMGRLRAVLLGDNIDGLPFVVRNGGVGGDSAARVEMAILVTGKSVTPQRIYNALTATQVIDRVEAYEGLQLGQPLRARDAKPCVLFNLYLRGSKTGGGAKKWRPYGGSSEVSLPLCCVNFT